MPIFEIFTIKVKNLQLTNLLLNLLKPRTQQCWGRLPQSGERSLTNPAIRGRFSEKLNKCKVKNTYCCKRIFVPVAIFCALPVQNLMQKKLRKKTALLKKDQQCHLLDEKVSLTLSCCMKGKNVAQTNWLYDIMHRLVDA